MKNLALVPQTDTPPPPYIPITPSLTQLIKDERFDEIEQGIKGDPIACRDQNLVAVLLKHSTHSDQKILTLVDSILRKYPRLLLPEHFIDAVNNKTRFAHMVTTYGERRCFDLSLAQRCLKKAVTDNLPDQVDTLACRMSAMPGQFQRDMVEGKVGETLLDQVFQRKLKEIYRVFVKYVDITPLRTTDGETLFHLFASMKDGHDFFTITLETAPSACFKLVEVKDSKNKTPIVTAAKALNLSAINELLKCGADYRIKMYGANLESIIAGHDNLMSVKVLSVVERARGGDYHIHRAIENCATIAQRRGREAMHRIRNSSLFSEHDIIEFVGKHKISPNTLCEQTGNSLFMEALIAKCNRCAQALMTRPETKFDIKNKKGETPLILASKLGLLYAVTYLNNTKKETLPNQRDNQNMNAILHLCNSYKAGITAARDQGFQEAYKLPRANPPSKSAASHAQSPVTPSATSLAEPPATSLAEPLDVPPGYCVVERP